MNLFKVILGDWSLDGHEKTKNYILKTDCPLDKIQEYYNIGVEACNFDITKYCDEFEDCYLPTNTPQEIIRYISDPDLCENGYQIDCDDYLYIWTYIVELGFIQSGTNYTIRQIDTDYYTINIGGYGLFR